MIGQVTVILFTLLMFGERIEDGLKSDKLIDIEALQNMVEKQSGNSHKKV